MIESFHSTTHGELGIEEVISLIKNFLEAAKESEYSLVIGSDSHERKERTHRFADIVTAIVIHRKRFGGKYFWLKQKKTLIYSLRDKVNKETLASLDLAIKFVPLLNQSLNGKKPNYHLEIHVDIGEHGETRNMIREIVGMISGNGFTAKIKPESFAASNVADRHT